MIAAKQDSSRHLKKRGQIQSFAEEVKVSVKFRLCKSVYVHLPCHLAVEGEKDRYMNFGYMHICVSIYTTYMSDTLCVYECMFACLNS